jgi:hypothetical protein
MKHSLLKCAAVVAGVIFGANGSFAAGNDWTYYAAGAEGNPTGGGSTNCIQKGDWIIGATYNASKTPAAITIGAMIQESEDHILDLRDMSVGGVDITKLTWGAVSWKNSTVREFYVNHLVNTGIQKFFSTGYRTGCKTIRSVEITSDTVTKLYESSFSGCTNLVNLVLNCPKLTEYENSFIAQTILTNEINSIVKPWATKLGQQTFSAAPSTLCGSFIVTNLVKGTAYDTFASSMSSVTNLWIRWPEGVSHPQIHGWTGVKKMKIELPESCTNMLRGSWQGMALEMDIGEIVPKHISWLNDWCIYSMPKLTGELVLTNLTRICKDDFVVSGSQAHTICQVPNVKAVNLAGPLKKIQVTFITTALTNLVLNLPQLESVTIPSTSYYPFYYASGAKVTILGAASGYTKGNVVGNWTREMVDNLFASVTGTRVLTLYCSKKQGWKDLEGRKDLTDEEKEIAPEGCFGVWESAAGVRKAWMVHKAQAGDPTGLCIRVQ